MSEALLEVTDLVAGYREEPVLRDLSLAIKPGERVALVGPNGCGKSTLLRSIMAELVETRGSIRHQGVEVSRQATDQLVRRGIGYLRQNRNTFPSFTVRENLNLAQLPGGPPPQSILASFPILVGKMETRAGLLSGGEQQALAVAMVLSRPLSLLLLDEPIAGLSIKGATTLLEGLAGLQRTAGFAVAIVEHRLRLIQPFVDRVAIMVRGKIVADTRDITILSDRSRLESHYML